jgi:hypothetical protein
MPLLHRERLVKVHAVAKGRHELDLSNKHVAAKRNQRREEDMVRRIDGKKLQLESRLAPPRQRLAWFSRAQVSSNSVSYGRIHIRFQSATQHPNTISEKLDRTREKEK